MFPTANSQVYYNSDGEPLGWDTYHEDAPDPVDYDAYDRYDAPEPKDTAECVKWGLHGQDGDGTDVNDVWECMYCSGKYTYDETYEYGDPKRMIWVTDEQYLILNRIQPISRDDEDADPGVYRDQFYIPSGSRSEDLPDRIDDSTGYTDSDFI